MSDKLRAAAQAALSAMSVVRVFVTSKEKIKHPEGTDWYDNIISNLEAALAEPTVQESLTVAEPAQKPMHPEMKKMYEDYFDKCFRESSAPPRREWVGLTDADFEKEKFVDYNFTAGASFAEAKLKEKNFGHI